MANLAVELGVEKEKVRPPRYPITRPDLAVGEIGSSNLDLCYLSTPLGEILAIHVRPAWLNILEYVTNPEEYRTHSFEGVRVEKLDALVQRALNEVSTIPADLLHNRRILQDHQVRQYLYNTKDALKVLGQLAPYN